MIPSKRYRLIFLTAAGLFIAGIGISLMVPGGLELVVIQIKTGKPLLVLPLEIGERFTIHYYHSVENSPIWEDHSLDKNGQIYIEEERYLKFGAGMGRMPGVGRMVMKGPYEAIINMHQPVGHFILRVGNPGVDHTVIWRGIRTNLSDMVPHNAVRFRARPISLLYKLWRSINVHPATPQKRKL